MTNGMSRRGLFRAGATGVIALTPVPALPQTPPVAAADARLPGPSAPAADQAAVTFLNAQEKAFTEAAIARLIPNEPGGWPGALEAGVAIYIDRQLGGAFGAGAGLYRAGPHKEGLPGQGYQLPHTPAELFRQGVQRLYAVLGSPAFDALSPVEQDGALASLEAGRLDLSPVPAKVFFKLLLDLTMEGYFSDPAYGGNRDMTSWRMIGFPGAHAAWAPMVEEHGLPFSALCSSPVSLAAAKAHHDAADAAKGK